jgi:hypothetical protein
LPAALFIGIVLLAVLGGAAEIGALFLGVLVAATWRAMVAPTGTKGSSRPST